MSYEEMRSWLKNRYPWPKWQERVKNMSDNQVYATYTRLVEADKKKEKKA